MKTFGLIALLAVSLISIQSHANDLTSYDGCENRTSSPVFKTCDLSADELETLAARFENALKGANHYSEADAGWTAFYTRAAVDKNFNPRVLALTLGTNEEIYVFTAERSEELLNDYISDDESEYPEEQKIYAKFRTLFMKHFTEVRFIKIGKPDSGALDLMMVGRLPDGRLVGVRTITVET